MRARRVALLADVHGNAPALAAVLREVQAEDVDLLIHAGDLTWGSLVAETLALVRDYEGRAEFVRGNADRAILELADGTRAGADVPTAREQWILGRHNPEAVRFLRTFPENVTVDVDGWALFGCAMAPRAATPNV